MRIINNKTAPFIMVLLAMLFGLNYIWAKMIVEVANPYVILFYSNGVGFLLSFLIICVQKISLKVDFRLVFIVNLIYITTHLLEMVGIQYTTSSNASFIMQISVLIIPIMSALSDKRRPEKSAMFFGALALAGIAIMTLDFSDLHLNVGDMLMLLTSFMFSYYIIRLEKMDPRNNVVAVVFYYFLIGMAVHLLCALVSVGSSAITLPFTSIGFTAPFLAYAITSLAAVLVQVEVVKFIRPDSMAIYYCLEPATTVVFAFLLLSEAVNLRIAIGGGIVILAIILPQYIEKNRKARS